MFFCKIAKSLCNRSVTRNFVRFATTDYRYCTQFIVPLSKRKLIKISGTDASEFLQGLVTNDMRHFEDNAKSMYAMFLNNRGRVLFDSLIHKWEGSNQYLMECDRAVSNAFLKHLNLFKLKRDVKLEDMDEKYKLWALLSEVNVIPDMEFDPQAQVNIMKDPRLTELGGRIIATADTNIDEIVKTIGPNSGIGEESLYKYIRYKLGVGEGIEDLPSGSCFPLESNCDYLHGVSFHKGCYIGQELTARIYHTGVIRKRLMPMKFHEPVTDILDKDAMITASCDAKYNIGKLKGFLHDIGLGLVKVKDALDSKNLRIRSYNAEIYKPNWWPKEAPKEKITPKAE